MSQLSSIDNMEYYKLKIAKLEEELIQLKKLYNRTNMKLPLEMINIILCYMVDNDNYVNLLLLSKDIYAYFGRYLKNLLQKIPYNQIHTKIIKKRIYRPSKLQIIKKYWGYHYLINDKTNYSDRIVKTSSAINVNFIEKKEDGELDRIPFGTKLDIMDLTSCCPLSRFDTDDTNNTLYSIRKKDYMFYVKMCKYDTIDYYLVHLQNINTWLDLCDGEKYATEYHPKCPTWFYNFEYTGENIIINYNSYPVYESCWHV